MSSSLRASRRSSSSWKRALRARYERRPWRWSRSDTWVKSASKVMGSPMRCAVVWRVASGPGVGTRVRMALHYSRLGTETAQFLAQLCYFSFRTLADFGFGMELGFNFLPGFGFTFGTLRSGEDHRALCVAP